MKTLKNQIFLLLALTLSLTACVKDNTTSSEEELTFNLVTEQAAAENFTQDDNSVLFEATADRNLQGGSFNGSSSARFFTTCATITVSSSPTYFKIITVDFGTGCTAQGILRSGKVIISLTDSLRTLGAKAVITFDNYYINTIHREGVLTYTNQSTPGIPKWERKVENGKFTTINGNYILHNGVCVITQTAGVNTPLLHLDDEFTLDGNGTVSNSAGQSRTYTTIIPLLKKANCPSIVSGRLNIVTTNFSAVLDYGDGTCDRFATISINGGAPRTIILRN